MSFDEYAIAFCILSAVVIADQNVDCPINCRCPQSNVVDCSSTSINNVTIQHIDPKVEWLDLSKTALRSVPDALYAFFDLVSLNLSFNEITSVRHHVFVRMKKLRTLDLSGNRIKTISNIDPSSIFLNNVKLQHLNLSNNPITDLGDEYDRILYSESLLSLDLHGCSINHIQGPLALQGLPKLISLDLSSNPLTRLDGLSSDSLISLDLSRCNLQFLRLDSFVGLRKLQRLQCASNHHLSDQFFKPVSESISHLDASYCDLDTNYASQLSNVDTVILKGNQIKNVVGYAFQNNTKLEALDLSQNLIDTINEFAFYGAESLRHLDLSDNAIVTLDENIFKFTPFLLTLNLSRNSLRTLNQLKGTSIILLDASHCEINAIDDKALIHLSSIQTLNVSYNFFEYLPENLTSHSLQTLDASYCRILSVNHSTFNRLTLLSDINLTGNRLVYLKHTAFSALPKLTNIALSNNPWKCDCYDENFKKLWKTLQPFDTSQLLCHHPDNVTGQTWQTACTDSWDRTHRRSKDIIILGVIVLVLLISGIIACVVAIKESLTARQHQPAEQTPVPDTERDQEIRESVRKFTQLPSYDEALLLPKPPSCSSFDGSNATPLIDRNEKNNKRQSATQTEETIEALLQEIRTNDHQQSPQRPRRGSLNEIEYINIRPLRLQCTEL